MTELVKDKAWLKTRNKYVTGFCNDHGKAPQHEGTKPRSKSGRPMPVCSYIETCPCACHYNIDKMFEATGMDRKQMLNPEYQPVKSEFIMPEAIDPVTGMIALDNAGVMTSDGDKEALGMPARPAQPPLAERRTPMGYAARGSLEAQVWDILRKMKGELTTLLVSEALYRQNPEYPAPSRGAIQAVWKRWEILGFATWAKGPVRFTGFIGEGSWQELERLKTSAKIKKRTRLGEARRSFGRHK